MEEESPLFEKQWEPIENRIYSAKESMAWEVMQEVKGMLSSMVC